MKSFNYNVEDDPIYKQYARAYIRNGQRAMRDTVDAMEVICSRDYWPMPTYGDITFGV